MIKIYTTEMKELLFTGKTFDECCCYIEIKTALSKGNVREVTEAIVKAVDMLCEE